MLILIGLDGETFAIRPGAIDEVHPSPVGATVVLKNGTGREVLNPPGEILAAMFPPQPAGEPG